MQQTTEQAPFKTYILSETMNVSVPIYQRVSDSQRVPITKRASFVPFLQVTVQDEEGYSITMRYKETCPSFEQDEQIEKFKIPANAKFSNKEMGDRLFKNGVLMTNKKNLQNYLENYPACKGSKYFSDDVPSEQYMLYSKALDSKIQNQELKLRVKAASKVFDLGLVQAQDLLIRLNGSYFQTPQAKDFDGDAEEKEQSALQECQNMLVSFVDAADEKGLEAVLKEDKDLNIDQKTSVMVGALLNAELLSFEKVQGNISKPKNNKWIALREISDEYTSDERLRLFCDFLNTDDGKLMKADLEKDLAEFNKPKKQKE